MTQAVVAGALAVAGLNLIAGAIGLWAWYAGIAGSSPETPGGGRSAAAFWLLLRVGQGAALTLAVAVGSLAAAGNFSTDHLFYLYALLPLPIAFIAEQLRAVSAEQLLDQRGLEDAQALGKLPAAEQHAFVTAVLRRETGVMAASAFVVVFLALRAAGTAHGF
jgi:hypothetical protein